MSTSQASTQVIQAPENKKSSAGAKVNVACKLPAGLRLRTFKMRNQNEPVMGGGVREVSVAEPTGDEVLVHGNAVPFGVVPLHQIINGYGITQGVSKDFWDAWLEANKDTPVVKNKLIFAYEKLDMIQDWAKEHRDTKSGLEPLEQENDPRVGRNPRIKVTREDEQAKRRENGTDN